MKKMLTAALLVLGVLSGCGGTAENAPGVPDTVESPDEIVIGDRPYHIDPSTCDPD